MPAQRSPLTAATDGWYQQVDAAAELQRVFLRIFEQVGNPDMRVDDRFRVKFTLDNTARSEIQKEVVVRSVAAPEPASCSRR